MNLQHEIVERQIIKEKIREYLRQEEEGERMDPSEILHTLIKLDQNYTKVIDKVYKAVAI